jgi:hypothetical protein
MPPPLRPNGTAVSIYYVHSRAHIQRRAGLPIRMAQILLNQGMFTVVVWFAVTAMPVFTGLKVTAPSG